jgi:hypothetical protein
LFGHEVNVSVVVGTGTDGEKVADELHPARLIVIEPSKGPVRWIVEIFEAACLPVAI